MVVKVKKKRRKKRPRSPQDKVVFSCRISRVLLRRARDAVYHHQGPPEFMTLSRVTRGAVEHAIKLAVDHRAVGTRPKPRHEPRDVHSVRIERQYRDALWDAAGDDFTIADLIDMGMIQEILEIEARLGIVEARPASAIKLRPGRRLRR